MCAVFPPPPLPLSRRSLAFALNGSNFLQNVNSKWAASVDRAIRSIPEFSMGLIPLGIRLLLRRLLLFQWRPTTDTVCPGKDRFPIQFIIALFNVHLVKIKIYEALPRLCNYAALSAPFGYSFIIPSVILFLSPGPVTFVILVRPKCRPKDKARPKWGPFFIVRMITFTEGRTHSKCRPEDKPRPKGRPYSFITSLVASHIMNPLKMPHRKIKLAQQAAHFQSSHCWPPLQLQLNPL